jgi:hypothetical protein
MARRAFNLTGKFVLFMLIMLLVARMMPYDGVVDNVMNRHVNLSDAERIEKLIFGESSPEPYDSVRDYISIVINALITVPLLGVVITLLNGIKRKSKPDDMLSEWLISTFRRFAKLLYLTFLFITSFRLLPYQTFFPDNQTYSVQTLVTVAGFNLMITLVIYGLTTVKITRKRNL